MNKYVAVFELSSIYMDLFVNTLLDLCAKTITIYK